MYWLGFITAVVCNLLIFATFFGLIPTRGDETVLFTWVMLGIILMRIEGINDENKKDKK